MTEPKRDKQDNPFMTERMKESLKELEELTAKVKAITRRSRRIIEGEEDDI